MSYFQSGVVRLGSQRFYFITHCNLVQPIICIQGRWLNLVLVSELIQRQTFTRQPSVHLRLKVSILLDDLSSVAVYLRCLLCFQLLPEDFDPLSLNLGYLSILPFSVSNPYFFNPLGILLFDFPFSFNQSLLY